MLYYVLLFIVHLTILGLTYYICLRKMRSFLYTRLFILLIPIIALLFSFVRLPYYQMDEIAYNDYESKIPILPMILEEKIAPEDPATIYPGIGDSPFKKKIVFLTKLFQIVYFTGFFFMLFSFIWKLIRLRKKHLLATKNDQFYTLLHSKDAYTFLNTIYIGDQLSDQNQQIILAHEFVHQRQWHGMDLLYYEFIKIIFWFHPAIYFLQKELKIIHEYLADEEVLKIIDKTTYTNKLLNYLFESENIPFVNSFFNQSLLKRRIQMLARPATHRTSTIQYVLLLPILIGIMSISLYASYANDPLIMDTYRSNVTHSENENRHIPATIKGCPVRYGNCWLTLMKTYIKTNMSSKTRDQITQLGPQMIVISFWIEEDGSLTEVKPFSSIKELSELAKSSLTNLPPISPALEKGVPTRDHHKYMIKFDLNN